ncbi:hypothetical protein JW935_25660, partial [candidate division KSB1 bacterium]|nr:hypothetical protein [candidate division KSB1 bacterium]
MDKKQYNNQYKKQNNPQIHHRQKNQSNHGTLPSEAIPDNFDITIISDPVDNTLAGRTAYALKNHGFKILIIHPETKKFFNSIGKSKYYCFLFSNDSFSQLRNLFDQDHRYKLLLAGIDPKYLLALLY